ncbi:hypothetical protein ABHF97_005321 [Escherichia coli]|uniref:hypothetical protein n=1 Tax=Escherichia coli TaxID=562 RepID=UPI00065232DF|nr:hypothetical protein [Escherichia coli]HAH2941596.1 hypothetical protein [Escherichia coli]HBB7193684.1 hypothetical protein [Escherichia coli]HCL6178713.1 hypothetical protein [Escherichia coli]HEA1989675.1 hypothetical protein [Escherichia coli]
MIFGTAATTAAPNSGERTANHFAVFVPQPFRKIGELTVGEIDGIRTRPAHRKARRSVRGKAAH